MHRHLVFIIMTLWAASVAATGQRNALPPPPAEPEVVLDEPIAIDEMFFLPHSERVLLERQGLLGDGQAAFRVSLHYSSGVSADPLRAAYWRLIAAENGNTTAQYTIWFEDNANSDADRRTRAMFWLRRAAASGDRTARSALSRIEAGELNTPAERP